ncbi:MAG: hypothetical protein ACW97O_17870, partial [Candidatus Thorarchaeota archaeon]
MEKQVYVFLELERVMTKLKFDDTVSGYALITNDGQPFLSFSLPDEVLPQIQGALRIHADSLKMMNVMTGEGTVILSRVDGNWVLAVLFSPDLQLGVALQKATEVINLMQSVILPPPPTPVPQPEPPLRVQVEESAKSLAPENFIEPALPETELEPVVEVESVAVEPPRVEVTHGCVVFRADNYNDSMALESGLNKQIKERFANLGIDILLMVDEKRTIFKIAESLGRRVEEALDVVRWCVPMN